MKTLILLGMLLLAGPSEDFLLVVDWNLENFFDFYYDLTTGAGSSSDEEFSPTGLKRWSKKRFYAKCSGIAKTLFLIADHYGRLPDVICFQEVENSFVLRQLLSSTPLRKLDYRIVHFDSPDHRGIDCALLYRSSRLRLLHAEGKHICDESGKLIATRDILLAELEAEGGNLAVLVNHHPSKVGGGGASESRRAAAMARMLFLCDSLQASGTRNILCTGDFNDDVWSNGSGVARARGIFADVTGTIKYNGAWEKIDGHFARGDIMVEESIFDHPLLSTRDAAFGGIKPLRSYSGPRYLGGISDHYPIILKLHAP